MNSFSSSHFNYYGCNFTVSSVSWLHDQLFLFCAGSFLSVYRYSASSLVLKNKKIFSSHHFPYQFPLPFFCSLLHQTPTLSTPTIPILFSQSLNSTFISIRLQLIETASIVVTYMLLNAVVNSLSSSYFVYQPYLSSFTFTCWVSFLNLASPVPLILGFPT